MTNTPLLTVETCERLLRRREVRTRIGNPSAEAMWRWIKAGHFPRPVKLNPTGTILAWKESEITAWIESRERGEGHRPVAAWEARRRQAAIRREQQSTQKVGFVRRSP